MELMKKLWILLLVFALLMPNALAAPDYLNMESEFPLVHEGENITLRIAARQLDAGGGTVEDIWLYRYIEETMNVQLEVEQILESALSERKNLMMASGDLPDIMLGFGFTPEELVRYGMGESMLLPINEYFDYMPHLSAWMKEMPEIVSLISTPDGNAYTLPTIASEIGNIGQLGRLFINQQWLEQAGMETPTTLEQFTAMLRTFKEQHPDCIPLAGGDEAVDPRYYILNALGFLTIDPLGLTPCVRDGAATIPAGDPLYEEYLSIMHQYYTEGLISEEFFTIDATSVRAQIAQGEAGVIAEPAYLSLPAVEDFQNWWAVKPLTSAYHTQPQWLAADLITIGGFAISADTEYPELCARLLDFWFSDLGWIYTWNGPMAGSADTFGMVSGWQLSENGQLEYGDVANGTYASEWDYILANIAPWGTNARGNIANSIGRPEIQRINYIQEMCGVEVTLSEYNMSNGDDHYRAAVQENLYPYAVSGFPTILYFTEDESIAINDLLSVIEPHAKSETAKFITGVRALEEFDDYLAELEALGFSELLQYYTTAYENYQANL